MLCFLALLCFQIYAEPDTSFTRVSTIRFNSGEDDIYPAVIDPRGQYAYFGTWTYPQGQVIKVDLSSFTRVSSISLADASYLRSAVIDPSGQYAYFGNDHRKVIKVDLTNFTQVGSISFNSGEGGLYSAAIDPRGQYAYFGTDTGLVVKVNLENFTRVDSIRFNQGEDLLMSEVIDPRGQYAYFGTRTGRVVKVDLANFTRVSSISFDPGEIYLQSAVIDPSGQYAYFGSSNAPFATSSPGLVIKVDLENFTRVGSISFNPGEDRLSSAVIDPSGQYAYFGTDTGRVVKVDLVNFTRVNSICFNKGEDSLWSAVIDPNGNYAYFGTHTSPSQVIKVSLKSGNIINSNPSNPLSDSGGNVGGMSIFLLIAGGLVFLVLIAVAFFLLKGRKHKK